MMVGMTGPSGRPRTCRGFRRLSAAAAWVAAAAACGDGSGGRDADAGAPVDVETAGADDAAAEEGVDDVDVAGDGDADGDADAEADAGVDGDADGGADALDPCAPAPLSPENGAPTGSVHAPASFQVLRPRFRWRAPAGPGCTPAPETYEIQADDSCATPGFAGCAFESPEASATAIAGLEWRPGTDLPVGASAPVGRRYYWRVRGCGPGGCGGWSAVRYVDVGRAWADFNGDGYSDVVVGAEMQDNGATNEGNAFVFLGGPAGVGTAPSVTLDNPANQGAGYFGHAVAAAGDLNADGFGDLIVGAHAQDNGASDEGNAFVFLGGPSGVPATPSATLDNPTNQASGGFGGAVAAAGDVDADGFADLIVGADSQWDDAVSEGQAYLYRGAWSGIPASPSLTLDNPADQLTGFFGAAVAPAGDVDGNGCADVIVGAAFQDDPAMNQGDAFVYLGSPEGLAAEPGTTLRNPTFEPLALFGVSVASAGDANGDGFADVVVGARGQDGLAVDEGKAFVFCGAAAGVSDVACATLDNPGMQASGYFGDSVAGAGDVNGDGYADVVIGADMQDGALPDEGAAFVFHGSAAGITLVPAATLRNPATQAEGRFGISVAACPPRAGRPGRRS
jgi:hypothetical protein